MHWASDIPDALCLETAQPRHLPCQAPPACLSGCHSLHPQGQLAGRSLLSSYIFYPLGKEPSSTGLVSQEELLGIGTLCLGQGRLQLQVKAGDNRRQRRVELPPGLKPVPWPWSYR